MERLSPAAGRDRAAPAYERHRPEETVLYGVVQSELASFLARGRDKGRGFCPSCLGRRMADTAAHLVDRELPEAPVR